MSITQPTQQPSLETAALSMSMLKTSIRVLIACLWIFCLPAWSLNIVLTNDDSWNTENIRVLKLHLVKSGHNVVLSTPCMQQSGKGGAIHFLKPVPVDSSKQRQQEFCVGDTDTSKPFKDFVEGTPVMAALYGIDILSHKYFGQEPDLLISGPNEGNNMGVLNNNSGTLGATMIAIGRGIPAIAVSANMASRHDHNQAPLIAGRVIEIIRLLEASRKAGKPLLPRFTGLNINLPKDLSNVEGYQFTRVGWNPGSETFFSADLSQEQKIIDMAAQHLLQTGKSNKLEAARKRVQAGFQGQAGISFRPGNLGDTLESSEAAVVARGFISISTIDASVQASDAKAHEIIDRLRQLK